MELRRIYLMCVITVMCAIIATMSAASAAPTISVEPSYQSVSQGDTFTVNITVDPDGNNVSGVDYIFCFDNTLLNATSLTSGEFFGGFDIDTYGEGINNTAGTVDYCELMKAPITEGVTTPGMFTTITFQAIGEHGISDLYFNKVTLSDPDGYKIPDVAYGGRVGIAQTQSPFVINGYVFNDGGSACNDLAVNITNLDTSEEWAAETDASSNYYQLTLLSCADVVAGDILRFDVVGCSQSNTTSHTVTQSEVDFGGFECNITLGTAGSDTTPPSITNVANGTPADSSVTITWATDEASNSLVKYGTISGVYTAEVSDVAMTTSHSIDLSGLSAGTTYYFVVNSTDASGNSNESEEHSFTTAAESVTSPKLVSCVITPTPPVVQGTNVSIDCLFSEGVDYEIRIENATGVLIEEIGSGTATNPDPNWWNTTTGTPAGTYTVNVTMDNSTSGLSSYNDTNTIEVIATAEMPTVSIGSAEGSVGDSVNVSINITDASSICAMDIRVAYNASILGATNVMNGSMIESLPAPLVAYHIGYVDVNISFVTYPEAVNGNGELFIVTFDVIGGNTGDSSPLNLEAEAYMADLSPVALETVDGVVTVTDGALDPEPYLSTYTISNTTITPNGDGIEDSTEIDVEFSEPVTAAILIEDASGVVKTLYTDSGVTDPDPQTWDGTDDSDNIVSDGAYQVNITMDDGVNQVVYNNTGSIMVMAGTTTTLISIPDVSATGMVTVPVTIKNVSNVGSCQFTLSYDPDVVIVSNANQSDFDSLFVNLEDAASGYVSILAYQTSNPGLYGNVIVANVTLIAVDKNSSSTPLDIEVTTLTDATPGCNPIPYMIGDGSFTTFLNGDVNGDSRVDVADCMYLAKHLLGVSGFETITEDAADVNGNGKTEASDCMYLAKHLAGIDGFEVLK